MRRDNALAARGTWLTTCLLVLLVFAGAYHVGRMSQGALEPHSDGATRVLYSEDMVHGNWLLRGWWIGGSDSYWLTDGTMYAVGLAVTRALDPALLYAVPAASYLAVIVLVALASVAGLPAGPSRRVAVGLSVLPLVLMTPALAGVVFHWPGHTGTTGVVLGALLALFFAQQAMVGPVVRGGLALAAFALLTAGEISDPYTTVLGVIPIMVASVLAWVDTERSASRLGRLWPAALAASAWIAAHGLLDLIARFGGQRLMHFRPTVIPFSALGASVSSTVQAFFTLAGADFFGRDIDIHLIAFLVRLAYLAGALYAAWAVLRHKHLRQDWIGSALSIAVLLSFAGGILGTSGEDFRYRVPPLILMSAVLARYVAVAGRPWIERNRIMAGAALVAAFLAFLWSPPAFRPELGAVGPLPRADFPPLVVGQWLQQRGLAYGYGGYLEAPIVTLETRGHVKVRAVVSTKVRGPGLTQTSAPAPAWRIVPYCMMSKSDWYDEHAEARFLILDPSSTWDQDTGVTMETAVNTFGRPGGTYRVGPYTVLVWDRRLRVEPIVNCD